EQVKQSSARDSVVVGADSLKTLYHPVHLAEAETKFGHIQPPLVVEVPVVEAPVEAPVEQPVQ
ncbi:MAG TPA: hypothetical protein VFV92_11330, partial [Candidatus Bathyarchaeia archaeon]|nr:hypothetical protein [Candidatus Bathyarchaeia archaeon]